MRVRADQRASFVGWGWRQAMRSSPRDRVAPDTTEVIAKALLKDAALLTLHGALLARDIVDRYGVSRQTAYRALSIARTRFHMLDPAHPRHVRSATVGSCPSMGLALTAERRWGFPVRSEHSAVEQPGSSAVS